MIGNVELPGSPLVSALAVLAGAVAGMNVARSILVLFGADVPVVEDRSASRIMGDHVLQVRNTPEVSELGLCEG